MKIHRNTIISFCDISPSWIGSFEEFLAAISEKLSNKNIKHIIVFREKVIDEVRELLENKGAIVEVISPSTNSIINIYKHYKYIVKYKPYIVHFHFYRIYSPICLVKILSSSKLVFTDHMGIKKSKSTLKKYVRRIYYKLNFYIYGFGIKKIICVSHFVKEKYSNEYGIKSDKLVVIYNGVNTNRFNKTSRNNTLVAKYNFKENVVTLVGLRIDKGPICLIKAAPAVINLFPNCTFVLTGDNNCKNEIINIIKDAKLENNFVILDNNEDISQVYNVSNCVVIPSITEEAFCFVAAEAMATDTPIVAFDSGAVKEVLGGSNEIIPKNYNILAAKIIECLEQKEWEKTRSRNRILELFSIDRCTKEYMELYELLQEE